MLNTPTAKQTGLTHKNTSGNGNVGKYFSMEEIMQGQWHSSNSGSGVESNYLVLR